MSFRLTLLNKHGDGSGDCGDKILGVRHPAENTTLRLNHLEPDALEFRKIRGYAIAQHNTFKAAIVRLANGGVHADFQRYPAHDKGLDRAIQEDLVKVGGVEGALARLINYRRAADGI